MNPFLHVPEPKNPFLTSAPLATAPAAPKADLSALDEVGKTSVTIGIAWGDARLVAAERSPSESFFVGEDVSKAEPVDVILPESRLGARRVPVVVSVDGRAFAVVPRDASVSLEVLDEPMGLEDARARGLVTDDGDAIRVLLAPATTLTWTKLDLTFTVAHGAAVKRTPKRLFAGVAALGFIGLSLLGHAAFLGGVAFSSPTLGGEDDLAARKAQEAYMLHALHARAVQEDETKPEDAKGDGQEGSTGARHRGEEGLAGKETAAKDQRGAYAVKGDKNNPNPRLPSRAEELAEARSFGIIGMLAAGVGGANAPSSPWSESGEGRDAANLRGNMWADSLGDAFGTGLGLSGIGEGGGGPFYGIGLDKRGVGRGGGCADPLSTDCGPQGIGRSAGHLTGEHKASPPIVRTPSTSVSGRLPAEVVQRIVRQRFGSFRACYETGLRKNPTLAGRVAVRFAIDATGTVASVSNAGSDLPDAGVVSCVTGAFRGLSFPAPESGIVTVVYPIHFSPGQ